jgi:hypothetical protein
VDAFLDYLQQAGPFTAPLCVAMAYALGWLNKERKRAWIKVDALQKEANALREKRADDLEKAAREYAEFGEATRLTLREWTEQARGVLIARGQ